MKNLSDINLQEINLENVAQWPIPTKIILCSLLIFCIILLGFFLSISPKKEELFSLQNTEKNLKIRLVSKAEKASNLNHNRKVMLAIEEGFKKLVHQLPSDTEVPNLLEDISKIGQAVGLKFNEISLRPEVNRGFFIELPIWVRATGQYHDVGNFVSGISSLERIVSLHDFVIKDSSQIGELDIEIFAYTYRYKDKEDE